MATKAGARSGSPARSRNKKAIAGARSVSPARSRKETTKKGTRAGIAARLERALGEIAALKREYEHASGERAFLDKLFELQGEEQDLLLAQLSLTDDRLKRIVATLHEVEGNPVAKLTEELLGSIRSEIGQVLELVSRKPADAELDPASLSKENAVRLFLDSCTFDAEGGAVTLSTLHAAFTRWLAGRCASDLALGAQKFREEVNRLKRGTEAPVRLLGKLRPETGWLGFVIAVPSGAASEIAF